MQAVQLGGAPRTGVALPHARISSPSPTTHTHPRRSALSVVAQAGRRELLGGALVGGALLTVPTLAAGSSAAAAGVSLAQSSIYALAATQRDQPFPFSAFDGQVSG